MKDHPTHPQFHSPHNWLCHDQIKGLRRYILAHFGARLALLISSQRARWIEKEGEEAVSGLLSQAFLFIC
jgi:hypothetical protein